MVPLMILNSLIQGPTRLHCLSLNCACVREFVCVTVAYVCVSRQFDDVVLEICGDLTEDTVEEE